MPASPDERFRGIAGGAARAGAPGLLRKIAMVAAGVVMLGVGLVVSAVLVAAAAIVGAIAWGYLAWRTRGLARRMREQRQEPARGPLRREPAGGRVIEGEAVSIPDDPR